jgi:predicted dehydrogenase
LRFHPVLRRLRELLATEPAVSIQAYVGQYLPDWRPGRDYREVYSSHRAGGGGVLRDLSHELDYLCWLTGGWRRVTALGGALSTLAIDSDDVYAVLLETEGCPVVSCEMNYLDRVSRRELILNRNSDTIRADLVKGVLAVNEVEERFELSRELTYRAMHEDVLYGRGVACTLPEGLGVMQLIECTEEAARTGRWQTKSDR